MFIIRTLQFGFKNGEDDLAHRRFVEDNDLREWKLYHSTIHTTYTKTEQYFMESPAVCGADMRGGDAECSQKHQ